MAEIGDMTVTLRVKISLWDALKLRIAGKQNIRDDMISGEIEEE